MLIADGIGKYFGSKHVLDGVDFRLKREETLAIVGPSGCGKSTLLYMLAGMVRPDVGTVLLDNAPVVKPTSSISFILQDYGLLPWRTIIDNVALGLKVCGVRKQERLERARAQLAEVGIENRDHDYPASLSGGEQQRVAIARAFVNRPKVMLLDEPFSSLDALTRERLQGALLQAWTGSRVPYVLVTHSLEEAVVLGKRILVLAGSPARPVAFFDNPGFGDAAIRESEGYFKLLTRLRRSIEEMW